MNEPDSNRNIEIQAAVVGLTVAWILPSFGDGERGKKMGTCDFEKSLAVVIGIDQYQNGITPLRTAVADAYAVASLLKHEHEYKVLSLLDESANLTGLQELIQHTLPSLLSANSRLLFYFAGHGIAQDGDDGPAGYLIPQDAVPGDAGSYVSMVSLHDALTALPCRHFLAVFDCCFAGAFRWSSTRKVTVVSEVIHRERYDRFRQDPAWQVITSASYDQPAMDVLSLRDERGEIIDSRDQRHSPFAAALLQALQGDADSSPPAKDGNPAGDGVITATELYLYLRDQVEVLTESHSLRQTPEICTLRNHDKGEYIFLTPGHELNLPPAPALNKENNPYRGLESFDQVHKDLFFGRDTEIDQLLKRLNDPHPMVVVLGASGTGKSSLVKAGLLPRVAEDPAFQVLPVMRPGNYPLEELARACMSLGAVDEAKGLSEQFAADETVLSRLIGQWQQTHPKTKLLLAIDQTEELITQAITPAQSSQFQRLVKRAMADHWQYFRVVATLRLDFEAQFQDEELREGWMDSRFVIPPMSQAQLREAIEKPAAARVLYFEPSSLIDQLVEDVAQTPGALPLLSFMLSELYLRYLERHSDNRALTETDYRALGGVSGAMTQRATQEYESLVSEDDAYETTVKHVMLRMVALEGGELARRRVPLSELVYADKPRNERVQKLLDNLIAARLVIRGQELNGEPYVEPAHDALVRGWDKLLRWKNAEQVNLGLQRELMPQSKNWQKAENSESSKRAMGFLWDENPRLDLLKSILDSNDNWLNAAEERFVQRSVVRKRNRRTRLVSVMSAAIAVLSVVSGIAIWNVREANRNNIKVLAQSAATSNAFGDSFQATMMALRAAKQSKKSRISDPALLGQINRELFSAFFASGRTQNWLVGHSGSVIAVQFSPDGEALATASDDGTAKLWNREGALLTTLKGHSGSVIAVQFSPDGETLATVSNDGTAKLWNREGALLTTLKGHSGSVIAVQFSPDGEALATASDDGTAKLWNREGALLTTLKGHSGSVFTVQFSPDGETLATASDDGTAKLWNREGALLTTLKGHSESVSDVQFSPDGETLATASDDGTAKLWNREGALLTTLKGHNESVSDVQFSPDGETLATASDDGTAKLWNREGALLTTLRGGDYGVNTVQFSPDGETLATASGDGTARLWTREGTLLMALASHSESVSAVQFSPDGETLATASLDGTAGLWNREGALLTTLVGHSFGVNAVQFSPDGETLATASNDGTAKLWNREGALLTTLKGDSKGVNAVQFSPDGETLATTSGDGTARLWSREGVLLTTLKGDDYGVNTVQFSPDDETLATAITRQ